MRLEREDETNGTLTSRVIGVKCLAGATATIFTTRPEPVYRTWGGLSDIHDAIIAVTDYDTIAAPTTWSR